MDLILSWAIILIVLHSALCKPEGDVITESSLKVGAPSLHGPPEPDLLLQRCYGRWGCFSIGEPFLSIYRPVNLFPLHPEVLDVKFFLKTRSNPDLFTRLRPESNESFTQQNLDPKQEVKFIVHGYLEHGHQKWIQDMIRELLTKDNFNVISVDWVFGAAPPYTQAAANARMVGVVLAEFVELLRDVYCIPLSSVHVIGHSLGAHVAGYAGQRLNKLGRITGLDPAEPYFQYTLEEVRLDPSDANFVDVIHTDGGSFITGGLGMIQDCGHVDFYPNGGKRQPGCNQNVVGAIEKEGDLLYGIRRFIGCNHIRAYEFFSESINSDCPFYGYVCDTYDNFSTGKCPWGCGPDDSMCAPMGLKAEKWKKFARDEPVIITSSTFAVLTVRKAERCTQPRRGLFVRLTGTKAQSPVLEAKKEYVQFFPGSTVEFLVSTTQMGRLLRLDLEWRSTASLLNPLTWRLFNVPQIHIRDVIVTHLETGERVVFCGRDEALIPHKIKTIFANQSCVRPPAPFMDEKKKKQDLDAMSSRHKPRFFSD
ncbi:inactive pancreatic lipase-related protein 1 [Trichonephila inaurata madagascariensis]|uniref:Inactive pancreatic lipase-related protein 1 n=1 Tax=Trichonephila inaurata madagascariensis TaxID=2747483 RepID=A0A8X7CMF3_9ARAC|nr:inactive pancreatic lipase-related protein 1 [Trichonephila inaurata madagascariensis]